MYRCKNCCPICLPFFLAAYNFFATKPVPRYFRHNQQPVAVCWAGLCYLAKILRKKSADHKNPFALLRPLPTSYRIIATCFTARYIKPKITPIYLKISSILLNKTHQVYDVGEKCVDHKYFRLSQKPKPESKPNSQIYFLPGVPFEIIKLCLTWA